MVLEKQDKVFYEFHIEDEANSQGSWGSLRVVLKKEKKRWYLVAVVHDAMSV